MEDVHGEMLSSQYAMWLHYSSLHMLHTSTAHLLELPIKVLLVSL